MVHTENDTEQVVSVESNHEQMISSENGTEQMVLGESNREQPISNEDGTEQTEAGEPTQSQPSENLTEDSETSGLNSETEVFENKDNWPDVAELVNLRGDETTVYLLADGRYMDRINAIYIFDGNDTWTDESGVEWNEVVK